MSVDCSVDNLKEAAKCFNCISPSVRMAVKTYLLAVIAGGSLDPGTLMVEAKEFQRIPPGLLNQAAGQGLAQWAEHASGPSGAFSWSPDTTVLSWTDSGGIKSGNVAAFAATADVATVIFVNAAASVNITAFHNIDSLPALTQFDCSDNLLISLDLSGCTALQRLDCYSNPLTTLDLSDCTNLVTLNCYDCDLTSLIVNAPTTLQTCVCYSNELTLLDLTGHLALLNLDCSNNHITLLTLTGCTALQILQTSYNTGIVIVGP